MPAPSSTPWPAASTWFATNDPLKPKDIKAMAPKAPTELLIWTLYHDPAGVVAMESFIGTDSVGSVTRTAWFSDLAAAIIAASRAGPTSPSSPTISAMPWKYEEYLNSRWNPLFLRYGIPPHIQWKLNPLAVPVRVWSSKPVWYDPESLLFYEYSIETGVWHPCIVEQLKRRITDYLVPLAPTNRAFLPTNETVSAIAKSLKTLGLKESTVLAEQPLPFANTMLFLKNRQMAPFSPAYYSRNRIAIEYDRRNTGITAFLKFLKDSLHPDDIELLRVWSGMVLLNRNPFHKIMILQGAAGSGKSTFIDILDRVLGSENIATLVVDRLEDRFELSEFLGKSLLVARDVSSEFLKSKKVHMLKSLSGDRHIKAEIKFSNQRVMLEGPFNIVLTSNSTLNISLQGDSDAWARRLIIIKFDPTATGRSITPNRNLVKQLMENEGSGIVNWMISGAEEVLNAERLRGPFPKIAPSLARIESLLTTSDTITSFLKAKVKYSLKSHITTSDLYDKYKDFCFGVGVFPLEERDFQRKICPMMTDRFKSTNRVLPASVTGKSRVHGYTDVSF